jgi:hypothetical protein
VEHRAGFVARQARQRRRDAGEVLTLDRAHAGVR